MPLSKGATNAVNDNDHSEDDNNNLVLMTQQPTLWLDAFMAAVGGGMTMITMTKIRMTKMTTITTMT